MNAAQPLTFTDCSKICYCIFPHDIIYVEADNIYSRIIQIDHFIRVPYPLHLIQDLLPDYFFKNPPQLSGQSKFHNRFVSPNDFAIQWSPPACA